MSMDVTTTDNMSRSVSMLIGAVWLKFERLIDSESDVATCGVDFGEKCGMIEPDLFMKVRGTLGHAEHLGHRNVRFGACAHWLALASC